ncbi:alpha-mannosidase 2 [Chelonus insularis]|uniref:alpha-mannosidase 2 n=1 Tax=Chelonus insularis TaxID=460826 RepID=UPI00158E9F9F|nr:alpha-mannosidase 2 [Chelonus insularis]
MNCQNLNPNMKSSITLRYFKLFAILGTGGILTCCLMTYLLLDLTFTPKKQTTKDTIENNQWLHLQNRLSKLEEDLNNHHKVINSIKKSSLSVDNLDLLAIKKTLNESSTDSKKFICNVNSQNVPEVDIQMLELYKQMEFDNPDGGVWKQGWSIKYDVTQWNRDKKLEVFVVPHSHNDPGWLETFEKYYIQKTQRILNNMVSKLGEDKRRKFIWAEISFFKLWWDEQPQTTKEAVKRLLIDRQLEIVAGGWVMPDEAVSHWMAQLTQLTVGHQWLKENLDYVPTTGWAIDPFGLSPTMPFLLKKSGLKNLVIQRVHYAVKKRLAREKNLEFLWRQIWDNDGETELLTHMMPFYSYDVPHTCGPDPKICCQFDFFRLPNFGLTCPWRVAPQPISLKNVAKRAYLLLDQYRKKSQLFRSNVVLAPLGDDFRYAQSAEWDAQYGNYQKLFDYMNTNEQLNVHIQFGTLTDYFDAVRRELNINELPSLSGDFFTYADEGEDYWSGYYTSRPFHKRLDRVLLGTLRASEIISSIAWARGHHNLAEGNLEKRMMEARQWHSIFQHHDGVTGTARDEVVLDYANKMISALNNSAHVIQQATAHLLRNFPNQPLDSESLFFSFDEIRSHQTSIGERHVLNFENDASKKIVIFNSLPRQRTKVITIIVSTPFVRVTDRMGQPVECQISPVWLGQVTLSSSKYELSFVVTVPGFGINTYLIRAVYGTYLPENVHLANITIYNTMTSTIDIPTFRNVQIVPTTQEFSLGYRPNFSVTFGKFGLLKAVSVDNSIFPVHLEFVKYSTNNGGNHRSGAYLFIPEKPEPDLIEISPNRAVHLISGPILSHVFVDLPHVRHTYTLYNSSDSDGLGLHIVNEVDISETQNFELAMRLNTDIVSNEHFFTDLNGLNMIRRQRFQKLPTQGNYYPLPAAAYIEDDRVRLTILTGQPLGVASMNSGQLEIMQDRRLLQDDRRGLGQGVTDNLLTNHVFTLIMEKKKLMCNFLPTSHPGGLLSIGGILAKEDLLHPLYTMHLKPSSLPDFNGYYSPLRFDLPINFEIANLRILPVPDGVGKGIGMILHRQDVDFCWSDKYTSNFNISETGELYLNKFFNFMEDWIISEASLTFLNVGPSLKLSKIQLCPHQLMAILFHKNSNN